MFSYTTSDHVRTTNVPWSTEYVKNYLREEIEAGIEEDVNCTSSTQEERLPPPAVVLCNSSINKGCDHDSDMGQLALRVSIAEILTVLTTNIHSNNTIHIV